jgi:hypothetical protein
MGGKAKYRCHLGKAKGKQFEAYLSQKNEIRKV